MLDPAIEHEQLLNRLFEKQDAKYRAGSMMVMKTGLQVYGVRTPDLRSIGGSWVRDHRTTPWSEVLALIDRLWSAPSQEERALAILLLGRYPSRFRDLDWEHFDRWRRMLDNWGLTDGLAAIVFGPWVGADLANREAFLLTLIKDPDVWSRRLALVATVPLNRVPESAIPDLTLGLVEQVIQERDPMITKAVSWVLRQMTKTAKDRVARFLEENQERLAPLPVREVRNKLTTGLKNPRGRIPAASL